MVLGSVYTEIYETDKQQNENFKTKIVNAYRHVVDINEMNYSGHYNLGILYYNEAVNIIKGLDYETDIVTLDLIQNECIELFKEALPHMRKAYELNPTRKDVLVGLSGIYFSLNELEKSEEIDQELGRLKENDSQLENK